MCNQLLCCIPTTHVLEVAAIRCDKCVSCMAFFQLQFYDGPPFSKMIHSLFMIPSCEWVHGTSKHKLHGVCMVYLYSGCSINGTPLRNVTKEFYCTCPIFECYAEGIVVLLERFCYTWKRHDHTDQPACPNFLEDQLYFFSILFSVIRVHKFGTMFLITFLTRLACSWMGEIPV